jgi:serine/threonine protein phosphatase PrpC
MANKREADRQARSAGSPDAPKAPGVETAPPLDLAIAKLTDVGRARPHNEDYVDYYVPPDPRQRARKGAIYLVADGMGGHQAGEVASQGAVELAIGQYYSDTTHDVGTSLVRAFRAANQQIYDWAQADPAKAGMGTTLVAAVILGRNVYVANVGDSRAYLANQKGIRQITEDHSWVEEQVRANLLTPEEARRHPQRNVVTRALGSKPDVEVDLFEGILEEGDVLVLCTDGLTGMVEDGEIAAIVTSQAPKEAARSLVDQANERGGSDNIGVVIVSAQKEPAPAAARIERKPARSRSLIGVMGGLAGVLLAALLVLGGWFGFNRWARGHGTATVPVVAEVTSAIASETPVPTSIASATTAPSTVEQGAVATEGPVPSSTLDPSAGSPTATLRPTLEPAPTDTPRPTWTPRPSPGATREPAATSARTYPAPLLVAPDNETSFQEEASFAWEYPGGDLPAGYAFDLRIWSKDHEGDLPPEQRQGAIAPTGENQATIANLQDVPAIQRYQAGDYYWAVVVVRDTRPPTIVGEWSEARAFTYAPPGPKVAPTDRSAPVFPGPPENPPPENPPPENPEPGQPGEDSGQPLP